MEIYGIDIQQVVADALSPGNFPDATLIKMVQSGRTTPSGGTHPSPVSYPTQGMITSQKVAGIFDAENVQGGDVVAVLVGKPLADAGVEPATDDRIVCGGVTRTVVRVRTNDARATYFVHAR